MYSYVHVWDCYQGGNEEANTGVECQISRHSTFDLERPRLKDGNGKDGEDNCDQGQCCSWLLQVVGSQTLER